MKFIATILHDISFVLVRYVSFYRRRIAALRIVASIVHLWFILLFCLNYSAFTISKTFILLHSNFPSTVLLVSLC